MPETRSPPRFVGPVHDRSKHKYYMGDHKSTKSLTSSFDCICIFRDTNVFQYVNKETNKQTRTLPSTVPSQGVPRHWLGHAASVSSSRSVCYLKQRPRPANSLLSPFCSASRQTCHDCSVLQAQPYLLCPVRITHRK